MAEFGIRARLRGVWRDPYGFESHPRHYINDRDSNADRTPNAWRKRLGGMGRRRQRGRPALRARELKGKPEERVPSSACLNS